jgi:hypothetical protein
LLSARLIKNSIITSTRFCTPVGTMLRDFLARKAITRIITVATHEKATYGGIPICIIMFTGNINGDSCIDFL